MVIRVVNVIVAQGHEYHPGADDGQKDFESLKDCISRNAVEAFDNQVAALFDLPFSHEREERSECACLCVLAFERADTQVAV